MDAAFLGSQINQIIDLTRGVVVINGFNKSTSKDNYYASQNDGTETANASFTEGDFFRVEPNTLYSTWSGTVWNNPDQSPIAFYDKDKKFIRGYYNSGTNIFTSPFDAYYCRCSPQVVNKNSYIFKEGVSTPTTYLNFGYKYRPLTTKNVNPLDPLYGKTYATAGDSITFGAMINPDPSAGNIRMTYGAKVAFKHNMRFLNYGVSGSTLSNVAGKNPFVNSSDSNARYKTMDKNIDYLTIFFGWNDSAYGTLGTISDTTDATYFGAWNVCLPYLLTNYPKTKIGLVVPYGCTPEMRQAVRNVAQMYGLKCLDLYSESIPVFFGRESTSSIPSSVLTTLQGSFLADGVHPNDTGYNYLAGIFDNFLKSL